MKGRQVIACAGETECYRTAAVRWSTGWLAVATPSCSAVSCVHFTLTVPWAKESQNPLAVQLLHLQPLKLSCLISKSLQTAPFEFEEILSLKLKLWILQSQISFDLTVSAWFGACLSQLLGHSSFCLRSVFLQMSAGVSEWRRCSDAGSLASYSCRQRLGCYSETCFFFLHFKHVHLQPVVLHHLKHLLFRVVQAKPSMFGSVLHEMQPEPAALLVAIGRVHWTLQYTFIEDLHSVSNLFDQRSGCHFYNVLAVSAHPM